MRASELLRLPVVGPGGQPVGQVLDVRLVQDGPLLGGYAALAVEGFVIGKHTLWSRLGYDRYEQHGPALLRRLVGRLTRHNRFVPWDQVTLDDGVIRTQQEPGPIPQL